MWVLRAEPGEPDGPARTFRLSAGHTRTIGRATRVDFVLDAPLVSRVHCRLHAGADGQLEVEDLDSTNGTFVNDRRVARAGLLPGDRLRVGRVEFAIERDDTREPGSATT